MSRLLQRTAGAGGRPAAQRAQCDEMTGSSRPALDVQLGRGSLPRESVRESVEEHPVSRISAGLPADLATNRLTSDLEASPRDLGTSLCYFVIAGQD